MALRDYLAEEIAADFGDGMLSRRDALRRLGLLGFSLTAAGGLLAACGSDGEDESAAPTRPSTSLSPSTAAPGTTAGSTAPKLEATLVRFPGPAGELQGAYSAAGQPKAAVLVIHENRGLTPHFYDVVGRLAASGYGALAIDLLSAEGGTAALGDSGGATAALAAAPLSRVLGDLRAGIDELARRVPDKKVGVMGFCFGGGMVWNLLNAGEARLAAAVPFYGPSPDKPDFTKAKAAVLAIYGALDSRVNGTRDRAVAALQAAGLPHQVKTYEGADHAFFNDTGARYNEAAATQAYDEVMKWFDQYLA